MSGEEDFLSRWSRRKRAAAEPALPPEEATAVPAASPVSGEASATSTETGEAVEKGAKEEFDLASLPPIDSIVAGTDISAFLKRGVPLDLTRAALRRAWSTDPAIRDFIGLAENAWDFNDPNAMPGFGPLDQSPEEVRQMLAQVMGDVRRDVEEALAPDEPASAAPSPKSSDAVAVARDADDPGLPATNTQADQQANPPGQPALPRQDDVASQQADDDDHDNEQPMMRRTHGGALPR